MSNQVVMHVSPHPDDEAVGAPGTLLSLRDAGWRVINLLTTLGRPADQQRRLREAELAARRGGFELVLAEAALELPVGSGFVEAVERAVRDTCRAAGGAAVLIAPSPHDGHPRHEAVGSAAIRALRAAPVSAAWLYGVWADLPLPNIYSPVSDQRMRECLALLECYAGELARNDYRGLLTGRGAANAVLGSESVFGFGSPSVSAEPYAELLTEVVPNAGRLLAGRPRVFSAERPLEPPTSVSLRRWLDSPSARGLHARACQQALSRLTDGPERGRHGKQLVAGEGPR
jgi:hypothetical protein